MAVSGRIRSTVDLDTGVRRTPLEQLFAANDNSGHTIEVTVTASGKAVTLTGATVVGYFIRADEETVTVPGSVSGSVAKVVLPEACYAVVGRFSLIVRVTLGGERKAVFWGDGFVTRSRTDVVVDPGDVIPSLEELLERIDEMKQATEAANTATGKANTAAGKADTAAQNANNATTQANAARDAANAAATKATTAATNADAATSKANTATSKANTATSNANTAATKANDAASKATEATTNANAAKDAANAAATKANTAATNADTATGKANTATTNANAATTKANEAAGKANTAATQANTARDAANAAAGLIQNMTVTATKVAAGGAPTAKLTKNTTSSPNKYELTLGLVTGDKGATGAKGDTGAAAGFGAIKATVDNKVGTPSVTVTAEGPNTAKNLTFAFKNLKGNTGEIGNITVNGKKADGAGNFTVDALAMKTLTEDTINKTSGTFAFKGTSPENSANFPAPKFDWAGLQLDAGNDAVQIVGKDGSIAIRQNDGGIKADGTGFNEWKTLLGTKDKAASAATADTAKTLTTTLPIAKGGTGATTANAAVAALLPGGANGQVLKRTADGYAWGADNNTTYTNFVKSGTGAKAGLVPSPGTTAGTKKYLREDGTWAVPPDNNTTYTAGAGLTLTGTTFAAKIANNLTTSAAGSALDASQGKALNDSKLGKTEKAASATTADKVGHALTFAGGVNAAYDGSAAKTVYVPEVRDDNSNNTYIVFNSQNANSPKVVQICGNNANRLWYLITDKNGTALEGPCELYDNVHPPAWSAITGRPTFNLASGTLNINAPSGDPGQEGPSMYAADSRDLALAELAQMTAENSLALAELAAMVGKE